MADQGRIVVLVHGWSVRNTDTYGQLPDRLQSEAKKDGGPALDVHEIWLGEYVSFADPVRVEDIARAFQAALERKIGRLLAQGRRFACITHSTGGPIVREWWHGFHRRSASAPPCPMSHLIMLAPANFGSALAQLGAGRISRLKTWVEGVQPGTGVLEWLELGSQESWSLNLESMRMPDPTSASNPVFPFVLTGQSINRALYDHLNSYTDEPGSDGVVRTAAANLNATYVAIRQTAGDATVDSLEVTEKLTAPRTAFALIRGRSHSGDTMGILNSIQDDGKPHPTVSAILQCLRVEDHDAYVALCDRFDADNELLREKERVEVAKHVVLKDTVYFHDAHSMVIFRIEDDHGNVLTDYDLLLIAGKKGSPDLLPPGFFVDRQQNSRHSGTLTYYFNRDVMKGLPITRDAKGRKVRNELPGTTHLGLLLEPRPSEGFVHYTPARLLATPEVLDEFIRSDRTTLVDIRLKRVVHEGVFELTQERKPHDFTEVEPGKPIP